MKKFFFALLISAPVFAAEIVVMDIPASDLRDANQINSRFIVNEAAGTVDAKLTASRNVVSCTWGPIGYPRPYPGPYPYPGQWGPGGYNQRECTTYVEEVLTQTEEIPGMTVADKIVSIDGTVCGKMGLSRVLKVPTFFMNGNCKLVNKTTRVNGEKRLQVKLLTK